MSTFRELLESDGIFVFDGAMGTRLYDKARDDVARRETTTWALALSADAHRQSETLPVNSAGHKPW